MGQSGVQIHCDLKSSFNEDTLEVWATLLSTIMSELPITQLPFPIF